MEKKTGQTRLSAIGTRDLCWNGQWGLARLDMCAMPSGLGWHLHVELVHRIKTMFGKAHYSYLITSEPFCRAFVGVVLLDGMRVDLKGSYNFE